jgi:hypothetical protein
MATPRVVAPLDTLDRLDHLAPLVAILQANHITILPMAASQFTPIFHAGRDGHFVPLPSQHLPDPVKYERSLRQRISDISREGEYLSYADPSVDTASAAITLFRSQSVDIQRDFFTVLDPRESSSDTSLPRTIDHVCLQRASAHHDSHGIGWSWVGVGRDSDHTARLRARAQSEAPWMTHCVTVDEIPPTASYVPHNSMRTSLIAAHEFDASAQALLRRLLPVVLSMLKVDQSDEFMQLDLRFLLMEIACQGMVDQQGSQAEPGIADDTSMDSLFRVLSGSDGFRVFAPFPLPPDALCRPDAFICFHRIVIPNDVRERIQMQRVDSMRHMRRLVLELIGITHAPPAPIFPMPKPGTQAFLSLFQNAAPRITILTDDDRHTAGVHIVNGPQIAHRLAGLHYVTRVITNFVSRSWVERVSLIGESLAARLLYILTDASRIRISAWLWKCLTFALALWYLVFDPQRTRTS